MNYKKFELIREGDNPLIRITYERKVLFGRNRDVVRDVVKDSVLKGDGRYVYCDDGEIVHSGSDVILRFHQSKAKEYVVNGVQ